MSTFSGKSYDAKAYGQHRPTYPASLYKYIKNYAGDVSLTADIGCGSAQATIALAEHVSERVIGVDPSEIMLAVAKDNVAKASASNIEFKVGNDKTLTQLVAPHSLDLVTVAEAAHWFEYPAFWETVHQVLKPEGTLAIWAYYCFGFVDYPESAKIIKEFSVGPNKLGPYWGPGQSRLTTLYSELVPPAKLFAHEERIVSNVEDVNHQGPFEMRKKMRVGALIELLSTYSAYHTWKEKYPNEPDMLEETTKELLKATGLTLDSEVDTKWETVVLCAKAI